ncbi:MAG: hypothetical protein J6S58_00805 [Lentisphaeria bacterium]|nr:hypothetical protein [Lentisphaeria bacterium]
MKHKFLFSMAAVALLNIAGGCINVPNPPAGKDPVCLKNPVELALPMRWIENLGAQVEKNAESTTLDIQAPFSMEIPKGFSAVGSALNAMICTSPYECSLKLSTRENYPGATLSFWRQVITRVLIEKHQFRILEDKGIVTSENLKGWSVTAQRAVKGKNYKYRLVLIHWEGTLYLAELAGRSRAFDAAAADFEKALRSCNLAFWRMRHAADCTNPFLRYDPVQVIPSAKRGLFATSWTPLQLGFIPYAQLWDSPSNVYGLALNLFYLKQKRVGGISYGLFNAVKESYGIQLAPFFSAAEENIGLSIGLLYNAAQVNNGLTIGLITRAEEGSHGVQIGLLNFNSSPDYLFCLPIINFPIFKCFR